MNDSVLNQNENSFSSDYISSSLKENLTSPEKKSSKIYKGDGFSSEINSQKNLKEDLFQSFESSSVITINRSNMKVKDFIRRRRKKPILLILQMKKM